jgi:hypothetical protein
MQKVLWNFSWTCWYCGPLSIYISLFCQLYQTEISWSFTSLPAVCLCDRYFSTFFFSLTCSIVILLCSCTPLFGYLATWRWNMDCRNILAKRRFYLFVNTVKFPPVLLFFENRQRLKGRLVLLITFHIRKYSTKVFLVFGIPSWKMRGHFFTKAASTFFHVLLSLFDSVLTAQVQSSVFVKYLTMLSVIPAVKRRRIGWHWIMNWRRNSEWRDHDCIHLKGLKKTRNTRVSQ